MGFLKGKTAIITGAGRAVLKDGKLEYENYFNGCNSSSTIHIYSVTKSIISVLIGIAIEDIRFFPRVYS